MAIDREVSWLADLRNNVNITIVPADLESGCLPSDISKSAFGCIVMTNYLHRPLLPWIVSAVAEGGILLVETFAAGNEHFGHPRNPDYLLAPGELLTAVCGTLVVAAYEHGKVEMEAGPAVVQRIAAVRKISPQLPG